MEKTCRQFFGFVGMVSSYPIFHRTVRKRCGKNISIYFRRDIL